MATLKIKNRHAQDMNVHIMPSSSATERFAFLQHDFGASAQSLPMWRMAAAYNDAGFTVFSLDSTNPLDPRNKSAGKFEDFSIGQHVTDMEDMIDWADREMNLSDRFALAGHGVGAFSAMKAAAGKFKNRADSVVACSPFIDGRRYIHNLATTFPDHFQAMYEIGTVGFSEHGTDGYYPFEKLMQWTRHNLDSDASRVTAPVYFITPTNAPLNRSADVLFFLELLPGEKHVQYITNASHDFTGAGEHFKDALNDTVKKLAPPQSPPSVPLFDLD